VFENGVLGRILGCRREDVIGQVKEDEVDRACSTHGGEEQ
jgi:hypothetical protein